METVLINVYKFSELSEDAQQSAIEKLWDINIDYDWWQFVYYDAEIINCEIKSFDCGRYECDLRLCGSGEEIALLILENHGKDCDTYKIARSFLSDFNEIDFDDEENSWENDGLLQELEEQFQEDLANEYCSILQKEYEYLTSRESIIETIKSNDYDFTEDGELY